MVVIVIIVMAPAACRYRRFLGCEVNVTVQLQVPSLLQTSTLLKVEAFPAVRNPYYRGLTSNYLRIFWGFLTIAIVYMF